MCDQNHQVRVAYAAGYRVTPDGRILNPDGAELLGSLVGGYHRFGIRVPGTRKSKTVKVHRLHAFQLYGDQALTPGVQVRHLDGNHRNNQKENLALGSAHDNHMDIPPESRLAHAVMACKVAHASSRYTKEFVELIRKSRACGATYRDLSERFSIPKSQLSYLLSNTAKHRCKNLLRA